jgi:hypothetical protein
VKTVSPPRGNNSRQTSTMKKITNNRTIVIICLVVLTYCLSILINKRISPDNKFDFKYWSPYYLIFASIIPLAILLPLRLLPSGKYANYVLQKEKKINRIIVITTGIILVWLILWHTSIAMGDLMDKSLKSSEAETVSLSSLKNDTTIKSKIGSIDSIELVSNSISSKAANFNYILHGKDSALNVEIVLRHEQDWITDTIIIK